MTEHIDYRKGRNLSALSFLIIVYILSGAELQSQGMMLGVVLQIEHTEVITYAVIALFAFSAYQFGIEMAKPNHRTAQRLYLYLGYDKKLRSHIVNRGQSLLNKANTKDKLSALVGHATGEPTKDRTVVWNLPRPDESSGNRERPTVIRSWKRVTVYAKAKQANRGPEFGDFEVDIAPHFYYWRELRALFFSIFYHAEAWEDIFPLILALSAYILILYNWVSA